LDTLPGSEVRVFAIWLPVLPTDIAPPTSGVMALLHDTRARQYWDESRLLSSEFVRMRGGGSGSDDREIVWDDVAVFAPGDRWTSTLPAPLFDGGNVVDVAPEVRRHLAKIVKPR